MPPKSTEEHNRHAAYEQPQGRLVPWRTAAGRAGGHRASASQRTEKQRQEKGRRGQGRHSWVGVGARPTGGPRVGRSYRGAGRGEGHGRPVAEQARPVRLPSPPPPVQSPEHAIFAVPSPPAQPTSALVRYIRRRITPAPAPHPSAGRVSLHA